MLVDVVTGAVVVVLVGVGVVVVGRVVGVGVVVAGTVTRSWIVQ
jgi:hypothetical protein